MGHNASMRAALGWLSWAGPVLMCLGLAAACRSAGKTPSREPAAPATRAVPDTTTSDQIVYELRGGFAGFDLELRIETDGTAVVRDAGRVTRRGHLTMDEVKALNVLVHAARLPELKPEYGSAGAVVDGMSEVVTVRGDAGTFVVRINSDPADEPPAGLEALTRRLRELALTLPAH